MDLKRILILGGGFGGAYALRYLTASVNRSDKVEITLVNDENFLLFSPLLHEVAAGVLEPEHIALPIRRLPRLNRFTFIQAAVQKIDLIDHKVITTVGTLDFDYLVLALGSVRDMSGLSFEGGNVLSLKTLQHSMQIRNHIIGLFEQASVDENPEKQKQLLTFVISGGGYIGIQLVTALRDFMKHLIKCYKTVNPDNMRIILVEIEPKIVSPLHTKLGAYVMRDLQSTGIEVRLKSQVTHSHPDHVRINGSEVIPTSTLVWVAGIRCSPQVAQLDVKRDGIGRVEVSEYLEIPAFPNVYAIGDCAHFKNPNSDQAIPPKAHTAVRQARTAVSNILADIRGGEKRPYIYSNPFDIVPLGPSKAVFGFHNLRLYGLAARLLWMAGYATLVPRTYNRVRILTDWLMSLIFGRHITFQKQTSDTS
jgi:NADH dehydrogenase